MKSFQDKTKEVQAQQLQILKRPKPTDRVLITEGGDSTRVFQQKEREHSNKHDDKSDALVVPTTDNWTTHVRNVLAHLGT